MLAADQACQGWSYHLAWQPSSLKTSIVTAEVFESCRRGVTEIERSNARRLKQQLPDMDEDPAAAQWREKAFNFYDKRSVQAMISQLVHKSTHSSGHQASVTPALPLASVWDALQPEAAP